MSKRLQVVLEEDEYEEIRMAAEARRLTVSEWVRRVLREARAATGEGVREPRSAYPSGAGVPLHIPDLPESLHGRLVERARRDRRTVVAEATWLLERALTEPEPSSLLELEGLGAALWAGDDAAAHVAREREAWD